MTDVDVLKSRLGEIDKRLAEIEAIEQAEEKRKPAFFLYDSVSYRLQELRSERRDLWALRRVTDDALRTATENTDPRRKELLDYLERERRENLTEQIARLEKAGDYRQARIWRMELVKARETVEREYVR
ncbi:hypothetical protein HW532_15025 [Kaustia mangrovi]|uniref:Uncharacterized protein n=1 Tax=Kaustia mangrovi TaxID=2593653 RepID=A0A7S8C5Q2_9HYPH|nr:hypothetical protein [Kaustia mangrovi]QPC43885.1 hypothetical protein HW532_15025 [Kaustia mangrovi]